ncbi:carbon-nitrogen hydrolase family protein [Corynebacterium frankenforstense]|uniref:carbon-nitrogen hydrolase family protein n=1 Tax=Corynebacterium TaxID=1716 RepID=UPI00254ABDFF|nr:MULTISPECIES: carbon-nitrogen hydrolase family protein [Corynebacterium]MDK6259516.1 carbon-nitrogen hydrolase family protein [Corynebacterium frankenforstense]MDK8895059.1 carbon-nitrogen hydrolase family protein [Corynebacterium sp. MSK006]
MRIAAAQILSTGDPEKNLVTVTEAVREAAAGGARVVVLPEASSQAFGTGRLDERAEELDGPFAEGVRAVAEETGTVVVVGMFRPADQAFHDGRTVNRVFNTALIVGDGVDEHYDKVHTYDAFDYEESATVKPGGRVVTFDVDGVRLGVAICFDLRFPELFRELACRGAHAVVVPTSWADGPGKLEQWLLVTRARAMDTGCYIVGADQALPEGETDGPTGVGHSVVVGPDAGIIEEAGDRPGIIYADIDTEAVAEQRRVLPVLPR